MSSAAIAQMVWPLQADQTSYTSSHSILIDTVDLCRLMLLAQIFPK